MGTITRTADTGEVITEPNLPSAEWCDGYDYMDRAAKHGWSAMGNWGEEGYDLGAWPYVIMFVRVVRDGGRHLYGFGRYVEGDLSADYYRSKEACNEAISRQAFWYWHHGQSDGPRNLPETFESLAPEYRVPSKY
ncbi:hypothetical protein PSET11_02458 [Arthrobacter ulcerisalmonis]|uniref:Uncharacterized protein n=1 Tax=Arthrobacter ulcerisalmonis TaxID=2483813 RepID=A0A3P5X7C5_9MICC|nr:hypothetical protein [Arthrobacter ulcerisalmonis]VDC30298.1 hypothetical protein PSET11_02458 [Arthrobacter ulcerisalmonis]